MIHPTAILDDTRGPIVTGQLVEVGPYAILVGPLHIGDRTTIGPHCVIGSEPEHRTGATDWSSAVTIGSDCRIREHVVIQRGITSDPSQTSIGNCCYLMHGCHVGHNTVISDAVTMSPFVVLGGHSRIHDAVTMGIGSSTHQRSTVGAYAMIGMGVEVTRDVNPGLTMAPPLAAPIGRNEIGMQRNGVAWEDLGPARAKFSRESTRQKVSPE